jgi:Fe-S oxidoreductase
MLEIAEAVMEVGGESLKVCMQCGTCTGVCPWNLVKEFSPRLLIRMVSLGLEGYEQSSLWDCVTCGTCNSRCPRHVDLVDVIRSTRSLMVEGGMAPPLFRSPLGSMHSDGNPWNSPRSERVDWSEGLDIPRFSKEKENLFFTCCTHAYDARNKKVIKKIAALLLKGGVSFGVLGTAENCCGDQAHKCGGLEVFTELESKNSQLFAGQGVEKIISSSPHCMNMFNKHYQANISSCHYTRVFDNLFNEGMLTAKNEIPYNVAYHDPCYLGRHNGIFDEPRNVLKRIPGLNLIEFSRNRDKSLCCGGGGGGIWSEVPKEKRFGVLRMKEAQQAGANVVATACPFCMIMFEDALKAMGIEEDELKIMDVAELLFQSVE